MKKIKMTVAVLIIAAMMLPFCACTSKTAVETTDPSDQLQLGTGESSADATSPTYDLSEYSFDSVYGSQLINYLEHQYTFDGQEVPLDESNFYFIDAFVELTTYATYGYYPATLEGYIDLSAEVPDGAAEGINTYGDFFVTYAERMLESTLIINKLANDQGLTLTDEMYAAIDESIEQLRTTSAEPAGMTLDEYLQIYYGPSCTEESFRKIMEHYYMADVYTSKFIEDYEFDESEIMVPNIRYALYYCPSDSYSDEEIAAQEALAQGIFDQCADLDDLAVLGATSYTNGECYQYGEVTVQEGQMDPTFEAWALDPARQAGDIDLIHSDYFGYFVVGYTGLVEISDDAKSQIAVNAMSQYISDLIDNGTYQFGTDQPYEGASAVDTMNLEIDGEGDGQATDETVAPGVGTGSVTGSKALDVIFVILASIGSVAIVGAIVFGITYAVRKNKPVAAEHEAAPVKKKKKKVQPSKSSEDQED
ncbi:MAG: hypothetical protein IKT14_04330 [Clostridiales bacterium]|nr:hypothetical protein [Clostridiales bacterium]